MSTHPSRGGRGGGRGRGSWRGGGGKAAYVSKRVAKETDKEKSGTSEPVPDVNLVLDTTLADAPIIWRPERIVSGGQTGADRGGLMAGHKLGIPTTGWMPKDYKCDDKIGEKVAKMYNLMESDGGYMKRDRQNADMSDAIIGFLVTKPMTGKGTTLTIRYFISGTMDFVPYVKKSTLQLVSHNVILVWDLKADNMPEIVQGLKAFLNQVKPKSLMIAGPCERTDVGLADLVCEALYSCMKQ